MAAAASANAFVTRAASGRNEAFSSPAFSRPSSPIRPSCRDWVTEGVRMDVPEDFSSAGLGAPVEGSEHRAERDLAEAGLPDLSSRGSHGLLVKRHDGTPVAFVAALDHKDGAPHDPGKPVGPVAKRRQGSAGRQAYPDRGHSGEAGSGEHRVRKVRRPDHHAGDFPSLCPVAENAVKRRQYTRRDVFGGPAP